MPDNHRKHELKFVVFELEKLNVRDRDLNLGVRRNVRYRLREDVRTLLIEESRGFTLLFRLLNGLLIEAVGANVWSTLETVKTVAAGVSGRVTGLKPR